MGLIFVLALWGILGLVLASVGGAMLGSITGRLTRTCDAERKSVIRAARLLPLACLLWAGVVFVAQAVLNTEIFHRDTGLGDSFFCRLPDGYEISFVDVTDIGFVFNPKTQLDPNVVRPKEDSVSDVMELQVAGPYLFGVSDSQAYKHFPDDPGLKPDSYFVLDTRTGKREGEVNRNALREKAGALGYPLRLEPIGRIYTRYRYGWIDVLAGVTLALGPLAMVSALALSIARLRNRRQRIA